MRMITSPGAMQKLALQWKRQGTRIGFVPTMGYLHEGHLSLVHRARKAVGASGQVVVSIYVNPTQFAPHEDLAKYPRDLDRDRKLCAKAGTDCLFVPHDSDMYPAGQAAPYSTYVAEERLSQGMEGVSRPAHFRGVTTIVAKLFNLVLPEVAVFGAKDWQQAAVIQKMVADLNFPVEVIVAPTLREPDGLAMSSRNKYLSESERLQAAALHQALETARELVRQAAGPLPAGRLRQQLRRQIGKNADARVDYLEFFDPVTLAPVSQVKLGDHLALAVRVGKTRLIDNGSLR